MVIARRAADAWITHTPDSDLTLGRVRRCLHLLFAIAGWRLTSSTVDLSLGGPQLAVVVLYTWALSNLILVLMVHRGGRIAFAINGVAMTTGIWVLLGRAVWFAGQALGERPGLEGTAWLHLALAASVFYIHLVNIRRPWPGGRTP